MTHFSAKLYRPKMKPYIRYTNVVTRILKSMYFTLPRYNKTNNGNNSPYQ